MGKSKIDWTDKVWNPITGCTKISPGCQNCYAERMAKRQAGRNGYPADDPFKVTLHQDRFDMPLRWKKPWKVFVNSMSDLFHPDVPFVFVRAVWAQMATARKHTFQVLTKRPARMKEFFDWMALQEFRVESYLSNVLVGVSVEDQARADERIPLLLQTPVGVRFVSCEPLLGPVRMDRLSRPDRNGDGVWFDNPMTGFKAHGAGGGYGNKLDWVICGGESGPGARPMHPDWARSLRDQCQASGTSFFFKQWGEWWPAGRRIMENKQMVGMDGEAFYKIGKKAAGRLLDGREWREMPDGR